MKKLDKNKQLKIILAIILAVILCQVAIIITFFVILQSPTRRLKEQLSLAEKYLLELNYEQAIASYQIAIEIDPKCEEAYLAMVDIYVELGDYEEALKVLEDAEEVIDSQVIQDRIAEVQSLIEQGELEKLEALDEQITQEAQIDTDIVKEDRLSVSLVYNYDLTSEDYLSNGMSLGYIDVDIYPKEEESVRYYYTENVDKFTLPWSDYVGFTWQDDYFMNNQEEAINLFMQSDFLQPMDISEQFSNHIEFMIDGIPFSFDIDTAYIYICIRSVRGASQGLYFTSYGIDDDGIHYASGYIVNLSGTVSCDNSYKNVFERIED